MKTNTNYIEQLTDAEKDIIKIFKQLDSRDQEDIMSNIQVISFVIMSGTIENFYKELKRYLK